MGHGLWATATSPKPHGTCDAERPRYRELIQWLRSAAKAREQASGGYVYNLDLGGVTLQEFG